MGSEAWKTSPTLIDFNTPYDGKGDAFPLLPLRISSRNRPGDAVEIDGYLDSGAQQTLIDGQIARVLGIDLLQGELRRFHAVTGLVVESYVHEVILFQPEIGEFQLSTAFSTVPTYRNLLGRDFFNLIQVGFREHQQMFYVNPVA